MPAAWDGPPDGAVSHREFGLWMAAHEHQHDLEAGSERDQRAAVQMALDKAERTMEARLAGLNEFREQLRDQAATFVVRDVADARHSAIDARMEILSDRLDKMDSWRAGIEGRTIGIAAAVGFAVSIVGIIVAVILKVV